jgi:hypothetical protein
MCNVCVMFVCVLYVRTIGTVLYVALTHVAGVLLCVLPSVQYIHVRCFSSTGPLRGNLYVSSLYELIRQTAPRPHARVFRIVVCRSHFVILIR